MKGRKGHGVGGTFSITERGERRRQKNSFIKWKKEEGEHANLAAKGGWGGWGCWGKRNREL